MTAPRSFRWGRTLLALYLLALAASHLVRRVDPFTPTAAADERVVRVPAQAASGPWRGDIALAYLDLAGGPPDAAPVLVLHGSPGDNGQVRPFSTALARGFRTIAPDLPGFGGSSRALPDYSTRAHARYLLALLDSLRLPRVHVVGYSMGSGVGLDLAALAPGRVASLALVSGIGVQEYELLGDYHLNHALHGLQLAGLWALRELTPTFGWFDNVILSVEYARNFYDTDQRPYRDLLRRWTGPMLLVQGDDDILVPAAIVAEHARLVPQSEIAMVPDGGHFMIYSDARDVAAPVAEFLARVEAGAAPTRDRAPPERIARAAQPFDPRSVPRPTGFTVLVLMVLLAAATLASEDLTGIAAGLLVSRGTLGYLPATLACLVGIAVGDAILFMAGRIIGRPIVRRAPFRWILDESDLARASAWFNRRGAKLVIATRFMPGTRLPTYVAAGVLRTPALRFFAAFLIAATLWTPLLVGASALIGNQLWDWIGRYQRLAGLFFVGSVIVLYVTIRLAVRAATWRGRRLLLSRWRRTTRWEFWPVWLVYIPVALYVLWLGLWHRSFTLFTCANPAIPGGGLVGESKHAILRALGDAGGRVAPSTLLRGSDDLEAREAVVARFMTEHRLEYPIVLKPDVGERGSGVVFAESDAEVAAYLRAAHDDVIAQACVPGHEYGVFYLRDPDEPGGRIFGITDKRMPQVTGDGRSTLERLILADDRAVCSAKRFLATHATELQRVPAQGETVRLTRLGTHRLGAMFLDGGGLATPDLARALDRVAARFQGFHFGRYDLRAPDARALSAGEPFTVIELNGVSSEATNIYDPSQSLRSAYRTLFAQWREAFRIGALNRARGARPTTLRELGRLLARHRTATRAHVREWPIPQDP